MDRDSAHAILLVSCVDRRGLIAAVTDFIYKNNGNIEDVDQHVDKDKGIFFMRIEWSLEGFGIPRKDISAKFTPVARAYAMDWHLYFTDYRPKAAVFVSKKLHCLYDLLYRYRMGQLMMEIPVIISNHPDAEELARGFGIDFAKFDMTGENRADQEERQLKMLGEKGVELVILARYMQILTGQFVNEFKNRIINIHHSFLPAFVGSRPYEQAFLRGVKIIGATSHYVTEELDAGPIIEQDVVRVSHRDSISDMQRKGEDLEKVVLARAVRWHIERKVLVYGPDMNAKTVIFD
ncbi:MAG: formyltetrahydrofolate deformylase [Elusimicrobia bacterium]|nr:formyltetrahydrofolate deformylase [Elusimicrobiota bacterium]